MRSAGGPAGAERSGRLWVTNGRGGFPQGAARCGRGANRRWRRARRCWGSTGTTCAAASPRASCSPRQGAPKERSSSESLARRPRDAGHGAGGRRLLVSSPTWAVRGCAWCVRGWGLVTTARPTGKPRSEVTRCPAAAPLPEVFAVCLLILALSGFLPTGKRQKWPQIPA